MDQIFIRSIEFLTFLDGVAPPKNEVVCCGNEKRDVAELLQRRETRLAVWTAVMISELTDGPAFRWHLRGLCNILSSLQVRMKPDTVKVTPITYLPTSIPIMKNPLGTRGGTEPEVIEKLASTQPNRLHVFPS